jgi:hypothetical protein
MTWLSTENSSFFTPENMTWLSTENMIWLSTENMTWLSTEKAHFLTPKHKNTRRHFLITEHNTHLIMVKMFSSRNTHFLN